MKNRFLQLSIAILVVLFFGCSTSSDGNENSTTDVVPVAPSNLLGTVASTTQINLSWTDNSTNEIGFKIERKTGTGNYIVIGTTASNISTYNDTGLTPDTAYIYRVYAYNLAGNSLTYSNQLNLTTTSNTSVNDIDGNNYELITTCNQIWTKSNLNVTKYNDGTPIPQVNDPVEWINLTTGAWCYYSNTTSYGITYGKLYNWYAVAGIYDAISATNPNLRKKLAPVGWHIPSYSEWITLAECLNGQNVAGGKLKSTGTSLWQNPNTSATNVSGFTAHPGGLRGSNAAFYNIGTNCFMWSSSSSTTPNSYYMMLLYNSSGVTLDSANEKSGLSVRCIKD